MTARMETNPIRFDALRAALGPLAIFAALLALTGASVFLLLHWRARGLPPGQKRTVVPVLFLPTSPTTSNILTWFGTSGSRRL